MLWIDLGIEVDGIRAERFSEEAISSLFRYASWCLLSDDEECQNAAIVNFYEELPKNARIRRNLHNYLCVEDFLGLKELFEHNLSKTEHVSFIEEFLREASQGFPKRIERESRCAIGIINFEVSTGLVQHVGFGYKHILRRTTLNE